MFGMGGTQYNNLSLPDLLSPFWLPWLYRKHMREAILRMYVYVCFFLKKKWGFFSITYVVQQIQLSSLNALQMALLPNGCKMCAQKHSSSLTAKKSWREQLAGWHQNRLHFGLSFASPRGSHVQLSVSKGVLAAVWTISWVRASNWAFPWKHEPQGMPPPFLLQLNHRLKWSMRCKRQEKLNTIFDLLKCRLTQLWLINNFCQPKSQNTIFMTFKHWRRSK